MLRLSLEGDRVKATGFIGKAQQELFRLQARMDAARLDRGTFHYTLDDESYVYGYILPGGLRFARIVCTPGAGQVEEIGVPVEEQIPDFLSGYVRDSGVLPPDPDDGDPLTEERPARVKQFVASVETKAKMQKDLRWAPNNGKLAVSAWVAFDGYDGSQHGVIKATMYTGRMRKLVQALLGFGKNPKRPRSIFGVEWDTITEEERQRLLNAVPPAYAEEVRRNGLQIRFDHRFYRTHGLTMASDNKQWVVEIGMNRGILAMPLLLHELTTTEEFRNKVRAVGREEAITILDEFGGFPTGEAFPGTPNRVDAWVRAGRILRLKRREDLNDFYSKSAYSSVIGWAFNTRGTEAHNTCWTYGDEGCQRGCHYAISINIQSSSPYVASEAAAGLWTALSVVDTREESYEAVKWKVHRFDKATLSGFMSRLGKEPIERIFDDVDAFVCDPIANAIATFTKVSEGKLYWPTPQGQQQIKFPEPLVGGLESHDLRPSSIQSEDHYCDTTMFVMFANDQLKYVKYFLDPRKAWPKGEWVRQGNSDYEVANDLEGDLYVSTSLDMQIAPMFYGTDFDTREELPDAITETFYKRRFKAHWNWTFNTATALSPVTPPWGYDIGNTATVTNIYRTHWFSNDYDIYYRGFQEKKSAVVVPFFDREAYYFADFKRHYGQNETHARGWRGEQDLHTGWRNMTGWIILNKGRYSGDVADVLYRSQWTDEGDSWIPMGDDLRKYDISPHAAPWDFGNRYQYPQLWSQWQVWGEVWAHYTVDLVTSSYFGTIRVLDETYSGPNASIIDPLWFLPSPNEFGDYQYIGESHNVLGYIDCIAYGTHLLSQDIRHKGAYPEAALPLSPNVWEYPAFVGVFDA